MERSFFDCNGKDPLTVDYYLSKLSFQTIGAILRGSEPDATNRGQETAQD
jgi:hypothetical protein